MGIFGKTAVLATRTVLKDGVPPAQAWQLAIAHFTNSLETQIKASPRHIFLSLYGSGAITGIEPGNYGVPDNNMNRAIAMKALEMLAY